MTISKFLTGGRTLAAKFPTIGAIVGGPITEESALRSLGEYDDEAIGTAELGEFDDVPF